MQLQGVSGLDLTITFSTDELVFICNAINETVHSVPKASFQTRTTETPERAMTMLVALSDMIDKVRGWKEPPMEEFPQR
jgi:hypothetical protein